MRRARLDGIWPCMDAGWTRTRLAAQVRETGKGSAVWKANFSAPESAAWHSSRSPALASLELFAQLDVRRHLDRSQPDYDPVAEQLLLNLLVGEKM